MRKTIAFLLSFMLVFVISLSYAEEPIAVRVNNRTFTRQQVQAYINQVTLNLELMTGQPLSDFYSADEQQQFFSDAADHFVAIGVLREKLNAVGLEEMTADEKEALTEYTHTFYDEVWNQFSDQLLEAYPDMEFPASFVTEVMEEAGYSMNDIYEMGVLEIQEKRLIDLYCTDVVYTDEELAAYYDEHFVAADREKYENNIPQFEYDVVLQGGSSGYIPGGFRFVKWITMQPTEEHLSAINAAYDALAQRKRELDEVNAAVVEAVLAGTDVETLRLQISQAQAAADEALSAYEAAKAAAAADFEPMMAIVLQATKDGVSFDELIDMYGTESSNDYSDDGFPFHPQSAFLDADFASEVSKLEKQGDITPPFFADGRVYIVCRMNDVKSGAYEPDQETLEYLRAQLLYERQVERLNELTSEWRNEMDVTVDLTGLEFPQY